MNKDQFITALQEKLKENDIELSKSALNIIVNSSNELVTETVSKGESIQFIGFGTFKTLQKKETKGRNPQTGAEITIAARKHPKFVPGSQFKDSVNGRAKPKTAKITKAKKATSSDKKKKA